jgi:hypothetical protein
MHQAMPRAAPQRLPFSCALLAAIAVFLLPPAATKERAGPAVSAPLGPLYFFYRLTLISLLRSLP